jgi:hypothetical protein
MFQIRNHTNHAIKSVSSTNNMIVIDVNHEYIIFNQGCLTSNGEKKDVVKEHQLRAHNQTVTKYIADIEDIKLTIMLGKNIDCNGEFYESVKIVLEQNLDTV